jgi:RNA polymerase-binding protein DksA
LNKDDIEHLRQLLLRERQRVVEELGWLEKDYIGQTSRETTGSGSSYSVHPADMATDSMEMEKAYMIGAANGEILEDIDEALRNIDKDSYGICEQCQCPIAMERLEAVPYARLCLKCKSEQEGSRGASR